LGMGNGDREIALKTGVSEGRVRNCVSRVTQEAGGKPDRCVTGTGD
jgi:hypothetical protein